MSHFSKGKPEVIWMPEPLAVPVVIPPPLEARYVTVERPKPEPVKYCRMVRINWFAGRRKGA